MRSLRLILVLVFCASCQTSPNTAPPPTVEAASDQIAVLQGATDQTSTVLSLLVPKNKIFTYSIQLDKTLLRTPTPVEVHQEGSPWKIVNIPLTGLHPGATYTLRALSNGELIDERFFKTLAKDLSPKIAVISCTSDYYKDIQKKQWELVAAQSPDLLFLIGDNVYVDSAGAPSSEKDIWRRYQETRLTLDLYKQKTLTPVFATWDDHDFGINNGDSSFPFKEQSKTIFHAFFPVADTPSIQKGPGVASYFEHKKNHYLFLDNRTFRTKKHQTPGDSHFGKEQEEWLLKIISKKKGVFWLISGDQFFGGYHNFESYQGDHPDLFKQFLKKLEQKKKIVLFVSGDRHIAELIKVPKKHLGYTTYELTSSGLHAKMFPGSLQNTPNSDAVFNKDGELNYLILKPQLASKYKMRADVQYFGENNRSIYSGSVEIER